MIKTIQVKLDVIESMVYFWQATNSREKVGEVYIHSIVDRPEMKCLYKNDFTPDAARKVLSAISNREILNSSNKLERKFWTNNMWMMEDLEYTTQMIAPIKVLNVDDQLPLLNQRDCPYETLEVHFIPGLSEEFTFVDNKLFVNFFRVKPGADITSAMVEGILLKDYVAQKLEELVK